MKDYVRDLYKRLSKNIDETPELFHYDYFKLEGGELYYIGSRKLLTTEGKLKSVGMIADILGKNRLRRMGFNIPVGPLTAQQAVMLNKAAEELPSESDTSHNFSYFIPSGRVLSCSCFDDLGLLYFKILILKLLLILLFDL